MEKILRRLVIVLLGLLLTCGCRGEEAAHLADDSTEAPELSGTAVPTVTYDPNVAEISLEYIKYEYNFAEGYFYNEDFGIHQNITGTAGAYGWEHIRGNSVIESFFVYEKVLDVIEWQKERCDDGTMQLSALYFEEIYRSPGFEPDAAFFQEHDLLVIDLLVPQALYLTTELDVAEITDRRVTLELRYDPEIAATADNCGVLYFVALPEKWLYDEVVWRPVPLTEATE